MAPIDLAELFDLLAGDDAVTPEKMQNRFNCVGKSRPRPAYIVPAELLEWVDEGFPKTNVISCKNGPALKWKRTRWRRLHCASEAYQGRSLVGAIYVGAELMAAFKILETRNGTFDRLHPADFLSSMDEDSELLEQHAVAVLAARRQHFGRDAWIRPREAFFEIEGLFIRPAAKSRSVWAGPLNALFERQYFDKGYSTLVLQPSPLEFRHVGASDDARINRMRIRRTAAMFRMYGKAFGVEALGGLALPYMGMCRAI